MNKLHSHEFVEVFSGAAAYGLDRETDEAAVQVYLQKISDDVCMKALLPRLSPEELDQLFNLISLLLRRHFNEKEYHALFLKEAHGRPEEK